MDINQILTATIHHRNNLPRALVHLVVRDNKKVSL